MQARHVAWTAAGNSLVLAVVDTALVAASYPPFSMKSTGIHGWPLVNLAGLGSCVLGAVILTSHPRHPIGWILTFIGLSTSISLATESYGIWVLQYDGHGTAAQGQLAGWVAAALGGPMALALLTGVFLLVPGGTYLSDRWRWVARVAWAGMGLYLLGLVLVGRNGINRSGDAIDARPHVQVILSGGVILITLMLLASVVAMLKRLRGATGAARQQLRVVTLGAAGVGVALLVLIIGQGFNNGRQLWWSSVPLYVSYLALVVCIGVAVLRYRLYDVEVIVSRAVVLAIATAFVAVGYVGLVVLLSRTVEDRTGGGFWWSLLATVVVALAFQPLRRRVLRLADRLAYGNRAAPYDALADFSARIGRSPATGELLPTIAAAAGEAVHARRAVVRLEGEGGAGLAAAWPEAEAPEQSDDSPDGAVVVPIKDSSGLLGSMSLTLPPGRDIRPLEHRLLSDIAEQAALALRNVRLELELAERVRQLDRHTRELAASRNRIMGAVDTERRRLESSIAGRVLPTMVRLRAEVAQAATDGAQAEKIEECVVLATEAVESLRELTRGIYPTNLTRSGLGSALQSRAAAMRRADAVRIDPAAATARFPERVEAAAYYCCVEVLGHPAGEVRLTLDDRGDLVLVIHGVDVDALNRLAIVDRIEACGGALHVPDPASGDALQISFPASAPVPAPGPDGRLDPTTPAAGVPG